MADPQLVWNPDNIRDVAESVGISALSEEAIRALTQEVEYRVGQVIVEAMRFMQQGKRTILGTQDIAQALKVLDVEPLYGYESTRPLRFGEASLGPGQPLFYIEDEEVDFERLINSPLPKVPRDISFTTHWLAIEGVQPSIPQNPSLPNTTSDTTSLLPKGPSTNPALSALTGSSSPTFKPQVKHILSKELILYFEKIKSAVLTTPSDSDDRALRTAALTSVETDESLQQLVPYFVQFIAEKVTHSLSQVDVLQTMMELSNALTRNPKLFLDPYITALSSSILTCLVGRGPANPSQEEKAACYFLRDYAASLITFVAGKYQRSSSHLKPRLARTFLKYFLDPKRPLDQHYGALSGLLGIGGAEAVRMLIVPNLKAYNRVLQRGFNENREDAEMVVAVLVKGIKMLVEGNITPPHGSPDARLKERVEEYVGAIVANQIFKLRDERFERAVLECRST